MTTPETVERAIKIGLDASRERLAFVCPHCFTMLFGYETRCTECKRQVTPPEPVRVAFDQWPLKRLSVRGVISRSQFNAGLRYYEHWYASGLGPLSAIDMSRVGGSSDPNVGMPTSIRQAEHRYLYRVGRNALMLPNKNTVIVRYVEEIVLFERSPQEVGKRVTSRTADKHASAVAIEFLKVGLDLLADAYSLGR